MAENQISAETRGALDRIDWSALEVAHFNGLFEFQFNSIFHNTSVLFRCKIRRRMCHFLAECIKNYFILPLSCRIPL